MDRWRRDYPVAIQPFEDADGVHPRHSFFYPVEQYDRDVLNILADLCRETGSETEIHLHHDNDSAANLGRVLRESKDRLAQHGLLSRDAANEIRFGFIHGNWALDNSHPQHRHCGVVNELKVLRDCGCYADFTLPSAPNRTQTRTINSLYYAKATDQPKSHDRGRHVRADRDAAPTGEDELLLVQGPLALNWRRRKWNIVPRIENSDITAANPPTRERMNLWLDCHITVEGRPNWLFVKLHTHGAKPDNSGMLLGEQMATFHRSLADWAASDRSIRFHYVTAREMVNILHAAEEGHSGDPNSFRNHRYKANRATVQAA
jgi:hypothetical protein